MSYIAFDLDALNVARDVGAAAGIPEERVTHGLLRMWAWCFREKTEHVTSVHVCGFFGADCASSLMAFGFLAPAGAGFDLAPEATFRVRGAERYLRISEARSKAGKARSSGAGRSAGRFSSTPPANDQQTTSTAPALTPSTEHRAPNTEKVEAAPPPIPIAAFDIQEPDLSVIESWTKEDFWKGAEVTRRARGYAPQKWPNGIALSRWWTEARGLCDVTTLAKAFTRFADDSHWGSRSPPAPFAGFMTQWNNFLPTQRQS